MGTTQAVIARRESGRTKPSTRTLERLAEATGDAAADFVRADWGGEGRPLPMRAERVWDFTNHTDSRMKGGRSSSRPRLLILWSNQIAYQARSGEKRLAGVRECGKIPKSPTALKALAVKLASTGRELRFCHQAGPRGYGIQRQFGDMGHDCAA